MKIWYQTHPVTGEMSIKGFPRSMGGPFVFQNNQACPCHPCVDLRVGADTKLAICCTIPPSDQYELEVTGTDAGNCNFDGIYILDREPFSCAYSYTDSSVKVRVYFSAVPGWGPSIVYQFFRTDLGNPNGTIVATNYHIVARPYDCGGLNNYWIDLMSISKASGWSGCDWSNANSIITAR